MIAAAAESILLANDEAHGELLRAFRNLVDRLIARHGELRSTMAEIEADLGGGAFGPYAMTDTTTTGRRRLSLTGKRASTRPFLRGQG